MNGALSPWEAEIPKIGRSFGNGAKDTLRQIRKAAMRTFFESHKARRNRDRVAPEAFTGRAHSGRMSLIMNTSCPVKRNKSPKNVIDSRNPIWYIDMAVKTVTC